MNTPRRTLLAAVPTLLLAMLWPVSAQAADEIGLSRDGVTWTSELTMPLFEPSMLWVPGDDETRTFQVRNQGPSAASVTIEALSPGGDPILAADVALSVRVDGGTWTPVELGEAELDMAVRPLESGLVMPVDVRAAFDPASTNITQQLELPLVLRVTLAEAQQSGGSDGSGGGLPSTGAVVGLGTVVLGLALAALGGVVVARRRQEEAGQHG